MIRHQLDAYAEVRPNLIKHASGYPTVKELRNITCTGQSTYGLDAVGKGKSTDGSELIIKAALKADARPLWVLVWGGANTLAQALRDAQEQLSKKQFDKIVSKLRVYAISDQDDAGSWIRQEFPDLFYIVDPSNPDYHYYYSATWNGIAGDCHNKTGVGYYFNLVDNPWLETNIMKNHGALGECYPSLAFQMEGDTPSFLGLINNGLGWHESPDFGGWGGRYKYYQPYGETHPIWTSNKFNRDTYEYEPGKTYTSNGTTIWRWRDHFQYDFAARMDWCVAKDFNDANHNPVPILNGDHTKNVLYINAEGKDFIELSAEKTYDQDNDDIQIKWWIYPEAGDVKGATLIKKEGMSTSVDLSNASGKNLHVILQVNDQGEPNLYAYRRVVIKL